MIPLVLVREDVDHGPTGAEGVVPDGLHTRDIPLSLQERVCTGPKSQLIPLHGTGMPLQHHPEGTLPVPRAAHTATSLTPDHPDKGGRILCGPTEGNPKAEGETSK